MHELFSPPGFFNPQLSISAQAALRVSCGILLVATLLQVVPHWRRFFMSERWGGYAKSARDVDLIQSPIGTTLVAIIWFSCAVMLIVGFHPVAASAVNLVLCRYFFVHMRWKGILRGFGAPGFMTYWTAFVIFALELTLHYAIKERPLALLVAQVDFALIMLSSGLYKLTAGYAQNNGMEHGMVSPQWGWWWKFWKNVPPSSAVYVLLNHLAWGTEVVAAILMLIPETRFIGGMCILLSFIFIATQIRLGVLCEVVMADCLLFFHQGSYGDQLLQLCAIPGAVKDCVPQELPVLGQVVSVLLGTYLVLLPLAHAGLFYNFYGNKSLPGVLQLALEKYTNFFGIIIWRVFSVDHTNFFPMIYRIGKNGTGRELVSKYGWLGGLRYDNVGESIVLTCLFTTLKYYASNQDLFNERLLRYCRTLPCPPDCVLEFEYNSVRKTNSGFDFVVLAKYTVDPHNETVDEEIIDTSVSVRAAASTSPVREGVRPGSYVPLK